ncbi:MAG: PTS sugar transporter subunit IIA [Planctomycetaceae bacterium]|nr:PTS sugar transporter subunit IIA [Planctomycetaceae bacterium]
MSHDWFSLDELAQHLGRDRREIEKLANRGRIPGRKMAGDWQFHPTEITHWLEQEMREYTDRELALIEQTNRSTEFSETNPVSSLLSIDTVQVPLEARTKRSVLETLVEVAGRTWQIWQPAVLLTAIQEREAVMSTAFDNGVAIPHPRNPLPEAIGQSIIAFGRTESGIPFGAPNRGLTDLFFLVLCRDSRTHLQVLARLGRMIQQPAFLAGLRAAPNGAAAHELIVETELQLPA